MITILRYLYRLIFGKNSEPIWRQFALDINGILHCGQENKVEVTYKNHLITIESYTHYIVVGGNTYEKEYLRAYVEFTCVDKIELKIVPQDMLENVGKLFGSQDIKIGNQKFDKKYIIQGNDNYKIQTLLADDGIQELIVNLKIIRLTISEEDGIFGEKPTGDNSMIYYISKIKVNKTDALPHLYNMLTKLIDGLISIGSMEIRTPTANTAQKAMPGCV